MTHETVTPQLRWSDASQIVDRLDLNFQLRLHTRIDNHYPR
jgi:hypothetical protein